MKMSLSSFDITALVSELQTHIGGYIGKIYHPQQDTLLIRVRTPERENDVTIVPGKWMASTPKKTSNHQAPSTFAMTLRKYLSRGKIQAIQQLDFERILSLDIFKKKLYHLIIELFSTGNIILSDEDNIIILPLHRQKWAQRLIKPGEHYTPPPPRTNPFTLDFPEFTEQLKEAEGDLIHALIVNLNLGGQIGEEICIRTHLQKTQPVTELNQQDYALIYDTFDEIRGLYTKKNFQPVIVKTGEKIVDTSPLILKKHAGYILEHKESYNQAISEYFQQINPPDDNEPLSSLTRIKTQQENAIQKLQKEITLFHDEGDFIYKHYTEITKILDDLSEKSRKKKVGSTIKITVSLTGGGEKTLNIDPQKTLNENAALKYEKSKKAREKLKGAQKALELTKEQLHGTQRPSRKQSPRSISDKEKKFWFERYRWFISSSGNVVIGGKDAKSNDKIVKKHLEKGDRYIHATIKGASSVIVKAHDVNGTPLPITEDALQEACQFAVAFSKAWNQFGEMDAYWVKPEQVSKSPPPGEFLPRGSFMITGERHFHRCPMEYAVTLITLGTTTKIMGAPPKVAKTQKKWVIITPGKEPKDDVAHKIATYLDAPVDDILPVLPPGDMAIQGLST